ncbi:hypothetical protein ACSBR2_039783 [Camellia fascicularis]
MKGATTKSIQEISDRFEALKVGSVMEDESQNSHPSNRPRPVDLSTPVIQASRWSDMVEGEQLSKFLDLPDSVGVAKAHGIAHPHGAIAERVEQSKSSSMLGELGLADMGDQDSGACNSPRVSDEHIEESNHLLRGFGGNNPRGGFQGRGRGPNMNNRGDRGGFEVNLKFFRPKRDQDKIVVEMPPTSPSVKWEACLVGYFIDKNLPYNLIKNNAINMWKNKGLVDILKNDDGFIFFMFENRDCCTNVLKGGPWYVGEFFLILKQWHRMMKLSKEDKKSILVWVKFYNIPLEYWDGDGLSRIASAVGVPLFMDQPTSSGSRISFARVCVNIQADSIFPDNFVITSGDESISIRVEYQGVPSKCVHCNVFGHDTKTCLSAQVTKLIEL